MRELERSRTRGDRGGGGQRERRRKKGGKRSIGRRRGEGKEEKCGKEEEAPLGSGSLVGNFSDPGRNVTCDLWNLDHTARTWEPGYVEKSHL